MSLNQLAALWRRMSRSNRRPAPVGRCVRPQVECLEGRDLMTAGTQTVTGFTPGNASIGMVDPGSGTWYLRHNANPGSPDAGSFAFGGPGWLPIAGDWNGDGYGTVGTVDPATETWYLRNDNTAGAPDAAAAFQFGAPGWLPVAGDWTGSGHTGIGVVDPATGTWYLRNNIGPGAADFVFQYGAPGWLPVAGDWNGTGHAGIGTVAPASMTWYLRNSAAAGAPDVQPFAYGAPGWTPEVGDWGATGRTNVGAVDVGSATWHLPAATVPGGIGEFAYGAPGSTPVVLNIRRPVNLFVPAPPGLIPTSPSSPPGSTGTGGSTSNAPAIALGTSALVLTRSSDGNSAAGVLTIANTGPASSVLTYQLAGSIPVPSFSNLQLNADHPTGQIVGGHSQAIQLSTTGLNSLYLGTFTGTLQVSDQHNATASKQIPISVTVGTNNGGANNGGTGNTASGAATFTGDIGFSFTAFNSDGSIVNTPAGAADGTFKLGMKYSETDRRWHVDGDTTSATLKQPATIPLHNQVNGFDYLNMTGNYSYVAGMSIPDGGVPSLDSGNAVAFELQQVKDQGESVFLIVAGTFTNNGQFVGAVVNPGKENIGGQHITDTLVGIDPNHPSYGFGAGAGFQVAINGGGRPGGVQLNRN